MQTISQIRSEAKKNYDIVVAKANKDAYNNKTSALEDAYKNMAVELGLTGEELNTLKFIKSIDMHNDDGLFMDVQKPTALNLKGQKLVFGNAIA